MHLICRKVECICHRNGGCALFDPPYYHRDLYLPQSINDVRCDFKIMSKHQIFKIEI